MRKKIVALFIALAGVFGASAQSAGDQALGINIGVAPYVGSGGYSFTNFQIGAMYQYSLMDHIRLEGDLDYGFKDKGLGIFDISANVQYLFNPASRFTVYPFVGIGYANVSGYGNSLSRFLLNVGVGGEFSASDNLGVGLKINYQYIKDYCRLPIALYVTYKF